MHQMPNIYNFEGQERILRTNWSFQCKKVVGADKGKTIFQVQWSQRGREGGGGGGWWYLMLLRKVSRYIGLKWTVFTFCLSQVARNNAVKGKQKNTISFLYNFKHCNFVETGGEFWNTKHNPMRSIKSWF